MEQFRPLVGKNVLELVAGLVDTGHTPEEAIAKEIREETGYTALRVEFLLQGPKSAGMTNETTLDYYTQVSGNPEAQQLESSEAGLLVREIPNSLQELKRFLASEEAQGKLISPGIWAAVGKALVDGKIS